MNSRFHFDGVSHTWPMGRIMAAAWCIIAAKCVLVWWAIGHWQVPVHPAWIIVPTLMMAALATMLWVTHRED
ncbi:MAG: hypothetical protein KBC32_02540 [Candidatus Didemnitutus sp.]|nr:hypothetical protein [Candidatus Didemnitutus sp.]